LKQLVFDIETDDVQATKIWCICCIDIETKQEYKFTPDMLNEGYKLLQSADKLIGHNIIGFDVPVIEQLTGVSLWDKILVDTLVLSRLFNPVREGNHGLEKWGYDLGSPKIEFEDYGNYSEDMLKYCMQDVRLNAKVFEALKHESKGFSPESVNIEMETYKIISAQRRKGFLLDLPYATKLLGNLQGKMDNLVTQVHETFLPRKETRYLYPNLGKAGNLLKTATDNFGKNTRLVPEEFKQMQELFNQDGKKIKIPRVEVTEFNLGSRKQIGEYLIEFGWEPKVFTPTGQPQVDEKILSKVKDIPEASLICDYLMYQKRVAQVISWIEKCDKDNRVRAFVNSNGAITGRMTHSYPNLAQVPSSNAPYGKECRSCWTVPKGYTLVGIDAAQLELRMLAHYMNDQEYTNEIINGDIHTTNQKLAGLKSRSQAKTFIYALIYGAGNEKLGAVAGGNKQIGTRLRKQFIDNLPSYKTLTDRVERASGKGFLKGLDGRKITVRTKHAALNSLLQGAGSIVMKQGLIIFDKHIKEMKLNAAFVCNVHDEWQLEVAETDAITVGNLGVLSIIEAGKILNLKCPLDGDFNVGKNWSETH
tara:strand:+ start:2762 stop:4531 length:1770 start_codon:yes stop_codon:yes gene_type:complete